MTEIAEGGLAELFASEPVQIRGALDACTWPSLAWKELPTLRAALAGHASTVRFADRAAKRTPWEGQCRYVDAQLTDFCSWLAGEPLQDGSPLAAFPSERWAGYCSYQHFEKLFADLEDQGKSLVNFRNFLNTSQATGAPVLWLGSCGARTPCHQDSYGCNIVAQVSGSKRWVLLPPSDAAMLKPQRLPYEDSSVYTLKDPLSEDGPPTQGARAAILQQGDLLWVPRHWFHAVECLSPWSLSLNQWLEKPEDSEERVREAAVRALLTPLLDPPGAAWWLNPGEELYEADENLAHLGTTAAQLMELGEDPDETVVKGALIKAVSHPDVIAEITRRFMAELGSSMSCPHV